MSNINSKTLRNLYFVMKKIRLFEDRVVPLISEPPQIKCPVHLYTGQEAIAAGVCENLNNKDYVYSTHRSHGHYIAKGGSINKLMAEMFTKVTGSSKGKGGSMHLCDPNIGLPGSPVIVASSIPIAVGSALTFSLKNNNNVSVAFFGDGAMDEGVVYESFNIAVLKSLPVIFVCENNQFATHVHLKKHMGDTNLAKKAEAFGLKTYKINGNDVNEVYDVSKEAVQRARKGDGPSFIECETYRFLGHVGPSDETDIGIRTKKDLAHWHNRCPILTMEKQLLNAELLNAVDIEKIEKTINDEIDQSIIFANNSPDPILTNNDYELVFSD
jgi:TPP-dependent pyruvate/acetoin dehydrogenase alpha subunit